MIANIVLGNSIVLTTNHATGPIKANCICTPIAVDLIKRPASRTPSKNNVLAHH